MILADAAFLGFAVLAAVFGMVIGSFLNVCIYRLPRGESVVTPRSHCPGCNQPVAAYDNIPVFSYLLLGGKCRRCRQRISPVYPVVELATGLVFAFAFSTFGISVEFVKFAAFGALMIVLVMTDWGLMQEEEEYKRLLPDRVTFPGMAAGLVLSQFSPVGDGATALLARIAGITEIPWRAASLGDAALGALAGGGLLFGLSELYFRLRHKEGLGLGDVKMMAMVGFFLGPKLVLVAIWLASTTGAVIGGSFILLSRKDWRSFEIPFGTFLGAASLVAAMWGRPLLAWYMGKLS